MYMQKPHHKDMKLRAKFSLILSQVNQALNNLAQMENVLLRAIIYRKRAEKPSTALPNSKQHPTVQYYKAQQSTENKQQTAQRMAQHRGRHSTQQNSHTTTTHRRAHHSTAKQSKAKHRTTQHSPAGHCRAPQSMEEHYREQLFTTQQCTADMRRAEHKT